MSAFIADTFNIFCFTMYMMLHCTTVKRIEPLIYSDHFHAVYIQSLCKMMTLLKVQTKPDRFGFMYLLVDILRHWITSAKDKLMPPPHQSHIKKKEIGIT